jgi:hypothetical protein
MMTTRRNLLIASGEKNHRAFPGKKEDEREKGSGKECSVEERRR